MLVEGSQKISWLTVSKFLALAQNVHSPGVDSRNFIGQFLLKQERILWQFRWRSKQASKNHGDLVDGSLHAVNLDEIAIN
ncbi:hypothetical protein CDES_09365 [Corynebacterium deserti GIMN1.010]|uniref:Uncharacterized protein n=1 Tax=Corynebacterium deserti GIMN1.010 TaxID=931089 RepID=A0A0M4CK48_9CORY|nr:hypothetical protein CDES_09365 [Corynebacterium deserti GIMN1.010]